MNGFPELNTAMSNAANNLLTKGAETLISSVIGSNSGGWGIYTSTTAIMMGSFADTATSIALSTMVGGQTLGEWIGMDSTSYWQAPEFTSMHSVESRKEAGVCDHPIEGGSFMSYNKVKQPESVNIVLTRSGGKTKRTELVDWLQRNVEMCSLYDIVTPEHVYKNMTLESFDLDRQAENGGTSMIMATCSFRQINMISVQTSIANQTKDAISSDASPTSVIKSVSSQISGSIGKTTWDSLSNACTTVKDKISGTISTVTDTVSGWFTTSDASNKVQGKV